MGLRDFLRKRISHLVSSPRPGHISLPVQQSYDKILRVSAADEQAFLQQQVMSQLHFLRAFDAEMRSAILCLHEPAQGIPATEQVNQLFEMKGRMTTVLSMTSIHIFGQAKNKTPAPVAQAKVALKLGAISGELEQILGRIDDLHKVLSDIPLDSLSQNHGNDNRKAQLNTKFCEGVVKLVLFNIYGKKALMDVYPENRKTIDEIRRDFKNQPFETDVW